MSALQWDQAGERLYETGVDKGVLYVRDETGKYPKGVAWNGLTNISESPSGAEPTPLYADNTKYLELMSAEEYGCTIEAYQSPVEFDECDGCMELAPGVSVGQQKRKVFGLCYRTLIGNDINGTDHGYKLHLVYGGLAKPSEKGYGTVNNDPEAITLSWEVSTTPVAVSGAKPTASLTIDSTKVSAEKLKQLEDILYGADEAEAKLPLPDEVLAIFKTESAA